MTGRLPGYLSVAGVLTVVVLTSVPSQVATARPEVKKKPDVSHFGKISVVGSNQNTRGGISSLAETMRVELNKICNEPARKLKLPIIVQLHGAEGDIGQRRSVVSKIWQVQGQYQLWLHVHLAKGVDHKLLRYHLMELFLYERGLGEGQALARGEKVLVRPWLVIGMLEAIDIKHGRADQRIYRTDIPYLKILPLQKVFDTSEKQWKEMIGRRPLAFRAISGAMVNSLFRQSGGRPGMSDYLADVATFKGETENLMRKHFPGMNQSRNSLGKWINLEMLELKTAKMTDVYSILETDKRLESILKFRYRGQKIIAATMGADACADVMKLGSGERHEAVAGARAELGRLSYRCFPSYRPLISEYEMILREVILGKGKDIGIRLGKLADVRAKMRKSGQRVRNYLDWYYITQSHEVSGKFSSYRDLIEALEKEGKAPHEDDSIGAYLDQIQRIFGGDSSAGGSVGLP